jgi:hypothetical protein
MPLCGLLLASAAAADPSRAVFDTAHPSHTWKLKDLDPNLPADWTGYQYLVLELRLSSPQRFDFKVHAAAGTPAVRLSPMPGVWVRSAIPLGFLERQPQQGMDMASVHNKSRPMMFINVSSTPAPLTAVREIEVAMEHPIGEPVLEIRAIHLSKEDPGDALLDPGPLVDEFGQWIHDDWPGKAKSIEQLKAAWKDEDQSLTPGNFDYCTYGGYRSMKTKGTGFFRVEKIEGKWWFVDPDGHLFFSAGADVMNAANPTSTEGREKLFAALPPPATADARSARRPGASFYTWNMIRRFGPDWTRSWIDLTVRRMAAWGLNTVGNWSDPRLADSHRVPYVLSLRGWGIESGPMGVADPYSPAFAETVERVVTQQCDPHKDDAYLLGYFLGNEPPWPEHESTAVDAILGGPATPLQNQAKTFLAVGDTPERRKAFLVRTYELTVETVVAAMRKHDPNHLVLGLRFASTTSPEVIRASKLFDVYSLNSYAYTVNPRELEKVKSLIDRPILVGEFHFGVPGRGMTPGLKQTANQEERGVAYRYYVERAAADSNIVGTHWFQWIDEPSTGRFDGENYNIGIIDTTDQPYAELVAAMKATHRRLAAVHAGKEAPVTRPAKIE